MGFLRDLLFPKPAPAARTGAEPDRPYLSANYTYGMHMYRTAGEDPSVYLIDPVRKTKKTIVDSQGIICNFPGVVPEVARMEAWKSRAPKLTQICFRSSFTPQPDGSFLMIWQIQPDGRYWEDEDGFGGTNDSEICLYAILSDQGVFDGPFRLYNIGIRNFYPPQH